MKKIHWIIAIVVALIALTVEGAFYYFSHRGQDALTEGQAIRILQDSYPELTDYPSDTLPPRSIRSEADGEGWYVAFVQEGSGRPMLGAKCFHVSADESVRATGEFQPSRAVSDFAIKNCAELPEQKPANRPAIVDFFACSDYCPEPEEEYMVKVYEGVTEEAECEELGGILDSMTGWGTTYYCRVK